MKKKPLRVLVIEDSEFDAVLLVNMLRQGGYDVTWKRVETAEGMRTALASQTWDFIFSDHEMPQLNAPAALALLQESGLDLPFIIVSGGIGEATAVASMKAGAHDYLMKGQLGRLLPAVDRELREAANRAARRQAERSLRESERRYRLLWENSPDAVVLMDDQGTIRFVNPAVRELFGHTPEEIIGRSFAHLQSEQGRSAGLSSPWRPGARASERLMVETQGLRKDGRLLTLEIGFSDMEIEGQIWFVAFIRDITRRREVENALRARDEELRVARDIQQRLFPKVAPVLAGFDIAGASQPAEATGGDYFDYLPMWHGRQGIVVGDVTGHGMGPAMLMAETRAYLRIVALHNEQVGEVLTRANRVLKEDVGHERFVTVLLVRLDAERRSLAYVNAGHPAGFLLDSEGAVKARLTRTNVPLGVRPDTIYVGSGEIPLAAGDLVLLLTDGFEEALSPKNEAFEAERALEVVRTHRTRPAKDIVAALYQAVTEFSAGAPQADDLTVVVVKVLPESAQA